MTFAICVPCIIERGIKKKEVGHPYALTPFAHLGLFGTVIREPTRAVGKLRALCRRCERRRESKDFGSTRSRNSSAMDRDRQGSPISVGSGGSHPAGRDQSFCVEEDIVPQIHEEPAAPDDENADGLPTLEQLRGLAQKGNVYRFPILYKR